jgi:choline dehydrogenase-like flavoprotein
LLLNSADSRFPNGLANGSGWVGRGLMVHSNHGAWGLMEEEVRCYKGPPVMAITEHWNYTDQGKDFFGGYLFGSQGPLPRAWAMSLATRRGLWGMELRREMTRYNHVAGLKMVGEVEAQPSNRVEVVDEEDRLGLKIPRITFSYSENDRRLIRHAETFMRQTLELAGGKEVWMEADTAHLMGGCRMGSDPRESVTDSDGRTWEIPNLWICDGSLFPTGGGVNPSGTIMALACRIGDRMVEMQQRGELHRPKRLRRDGLR